ncbi:uncharacterized protein LOC142496102 [Ascaphus truei]|uniref:uncharacterized protein LOC142496102 n=1 Tax=Ascaphus truei TaxID=8439 RepID=UPI003F5A2D81
MRVLQCHQELQHPTWTPPTVIQQNRAPHLTFLIPLFLSKGSAQGAGGGRPEGGERWLRDGPVWVQESEGKETSEVNPLTIVNLSDIVLTPTQVSVLQRGLSFAPTHHCDTFEWIKDVQLFCWKLLLHKHFLKTATEEECVDSDTSDLMFTPVSSQNQVAVTVISNELGPVAHVRPRSTFCPPMQVCSQVEVFSNMVINAITNLSDALSPSNISKSEWGAINELKSLTDIVIKPSDKGGNIVLWPRLSYEAEVFKQLRDAQCYRELPGDPTVRFKGELDTMIHEAMAQGTITKRHHDGLVTKCPVIPTLYLLPKIHKNLSYLPGCPIVSGIGGMCEPISRFLDAFLHLSVETLPSYLRDSMDILSRLDNILIDDQILLVTCRRNIVHMYPP